MNMRIMLWVASAIFVLDQLSKYLVVQMMDLKSLGSIEVWPPYVNFRMAWNRGINFGLFSGESDATRWILISIALLIVIGVVVWMRKEQTGLAGQVSAGVLIGGALGNIIDRFIYGAVADFLNVSCCGINNPFAFNVADISIFAGAFGLIIFTGQQKSA